jgi:uncharacterized protein
MVYHRENYLLGILILSFEWFAGFNCAKVSSKIEKLICRNAKFNKLDNEFNVIYKHCLSIILDADT